MMEIKDGMMRRSMDNSLGNMTEPASTAAAAGMAGWKLLGGAIGAASLASLVVMCMLPPRSPREWVVGIVSTFLGSVCGGAMAIKYLDLQSWVHDYVGLVALIGLAFACGLPAWMLVRWTFTYMQRRADKDLAEVAGEVSSVVRGRQA